MLGRLRASVSGGGDYPSIMHGYHAPGNMVDAKSPAWPLVLHKFGIFVF